MAKFRVETELTAGDAKKAKGAFAGVVDEAKKTNKAVGDLKKTVLAYFGVFGGVQLALAPMRAMLGVFHESVAASKTATAAQERLDGAVKGLYASIGDQLAPALARAGVNLEKAFADPEVQEGLRTIGTYLAAMVEGVADVAAEIARFVGSSGFKDFLHFVEAITQHPLAPLTGDKQAIADTMKQLELMDEYNRIQANATKLAADWLDQTKKNAAEQKRLAEEQRKAAEAEAKAIQALRDKYDPTAAALRKLNEEQAKWNALVTAGKVPADEYNRAIASIIGQIKQLTGQYDIVAPQLDFEQLAVDSQLSARLTELTAEATLSGLKIAMENPPPAEITVAPSFSTILGDLMKEASGQLAIDVYSGLADSFSRSIAEWVKTGKLSVKDLGASLTDALLDAAQTWFSAMMKAIAQAAVASKAIGGGSGASGSGRYGDAASALAGSGGSGSGAWSFMTGGSAAASVAWAAVVVAAVLAISNAVKKHADAVKYGTSVLVDSINDIDGAVGTSVRGRKQETGGAIAEGIRSILLALQGAAGALIEELPRIEIKVRNDGKLFSAWIGDHFLGQFKDAEEAVKAAAIAAFQGADFAGELSPILQSVISGFEGSDPAKLIEALTTVRSVMDQVAGLTDIEIQIRDLDGAAAGLMNSLIGAGVAMQDAANVAQQWQISQLANIRDQITGHEETVAEQRATFERQRTLFNAQLELQRLELSAKLEKLRADAAITNAGIVQWTQEGLTRAAYLENRAIQLQIEGDLDTFSIDGRMNYLDALRGVYGAEIETTDWHVRSLAGANSALAQQYAASIAAIEAALAALDQIKPIDAGEFRPRGGGRGHGGGGGYSGPDLPSDEERAREEFERWLADLNEQLRVASITGGTYATQLDQIQQALYRNMETAGENEDARAAAAALYWRQLAGLVEQAIGNLGIASVDTVNRFRELGDQLAFLQQQGGITADQFRELGDTMFVALADGLLQYVQNEDARRFLEDLRFRMELANYRLQFELLQKQGLLTAAEIGMIDELLQQIDEAYQAGQLDFQLPTVPETGAGGGGRDEAAEALKREMERLRRAVDALREFQESLRLSDLSPLTVEQQFAEAQAQYQALLAQAMAGNVDAIEGLPDAARTLLELAAQMFDTSGSGYSSIFDLIEQQLLDVIGVGEGILANAPDPVTEAITGVGAQLHADLLAIQQQIANSGTIYGGPVQVPPGGGLPGTPNPSPFAGGVAGLFAGAGSGPVEVSSPQLDRIERRLASLEEHSKKSVAATKEATLQAKQISLQKSRAGEAGWKRRAG